MADLEFGDVRKVSVRRQFLSLFWNLPFQSESFRHGILAGNPPFRRLGQLASFGRREPFDRTGNAGEMEGIEMVVMVLVLVWLLVLIPLGLRKRSDYQLSSSVARFRRQRQLLQRVYVESGRGKCHPISGCRAFS